MKNWIKYKFAKFMLNRLGKKMKGEITEDDADRFNHLQFIIISKGNIKAKWTKIFPWLRPKRRKRQNATN